jgi:hypothetical protein
MNGYLKFAPHLGVAAGRTTLIRDGAATLKRWNDYFSVQGVLSLNEGSKRGTQTG